MHLGPAVARRQQPSRQQVSLLKSLTLDEGWAIMGHLTPEMGVVLILKCCLPLQAKDQGSFFRGVELTRPLGLAPTCSQ